MQWVEQLAELPLETASVELRSWLTDVGSTTARLTNVQGDYQGRVEVCEAGWQGDQFMRTVLLYAGQQPLMVAFSEVDAAAMATTQGEALLTLGERPLGSWLFAELGLERQQLCYACLTPADSLYQRVQSHIDCPQPVLWARRCQFSQQAFILQLTEVFLLG